MKFLTRKLVTPADLNPRGYLHGGQLLKWIDEEGGIHAALELQTALIVTKYISEIIQKKIDLGIQLDSSIYVEFEKNTKHLNLIFATGIDFIYEFFNFERKNKNTNINKIIKFLGKNKNINSIFTKYADEGLTI